MATEIVVGLALAVAIAILIGQALWYAGEYARQIKEEDE